MSFGSNLISLREEIGMTRKELAKALEIPYTTLRNYETDQREPGHKLLILMAHTFSVSVDFLLGIDLDRGTKGDVIAPALSLEGIKIANTYQSAGEGIKEGVRKLLDIRDEQDEEIERELATYRAELEAESKGAVKSSALRIAKEA